MVLLEPDIQIHAQGSNAGYALNDASFELLSGSIAREPGLIHPPARDLRESYEGGFAVMAIDHSRDNRPVGYLRLEPLLNDKMREKLGLPEGFPRIMELGTMFVENDPQYRGRGFMKAMTRELFESCMDDIQSGNLIVIGTTKDYRVISVLQGLEGSEFGVCHHLDFPHVAALTCICSGAFGSGFHENPYACSSRIDDSTIGRQELLDQLLQELRMSETRSQIPCVMFVSDREFARSADTELARHFSGHDSVTNLRDRLMQAGYYPAAPKSCSQQSSFVPIEQLLAGIPVRQQERAI